MFSRSAILVRRCIASAGRLQFLDRDHHGLFLNDLNDCKRVGSDSRIGEVNHCAFQYLLLLKSRSQLLGVWKKNVSEMKPHLVDIFLPNVQISFKSITYL